MPTTIEKRQLRATGRPSAELVGALKALADGNRLRIIDLLHQGEVCVCEMTEALGLPQNLVSHHLRVLREVGLVKERRDRRDARWVYYIIDPHALGETWRQLDAVFNPERLSERTASCDTAAKDCR